MVVFVLAYIHSILHFIDDCTYYSILISFIHLNILCIVVYFIMCCLYRIFSVLILRIIFAIFHTMCTFQLYTIF